jgi:hypothetical protein
MKEMDGKNVVLCGSSCYEQKYYLNPYFDRLPEEIKKELKIMCVLFTEDVGGVLLLEFKPDGSLIFKTEAGGDDLVFDDIGAEMKIKELTENKQELLSKLVLYYKAKRGLLKIN